MSIPFRTRENLRKFWVTVFAVVLFVVLALICWVMWLNRYVIYSQDGAKLDFSWPFGVGEGQTPVKPEPWPVPTLHQKDPEEDSDFEEDTSLKQFSGYYLSIDAFLEDWDTAMSQLDALPKGSTLLLELKDVKSYVYYTSEVAEEKPNFDTGKMDALVKALQDRGHYVIAQIPAFQEYHYILENERERVPYGIPKASGNGALWLDTSGPNYWMNPASDGTVAYLIQLISEIRNLGFDEVVLSDFRIPETNKIRFEGDRKQILEKTAATLVKTCSTDRFCVSFTRTSADLTLPEGRTRLYLTGVSAANADEEAAKSGFSDPGAKLVFLADSADTRYEEFSVLRPLSSAH